MHKPALEAAPLVLVAMGGHAFIQKDQQGTIEDREQNAAYIAKQLMYLVQRDYRMVVTHGNGPQVGHLLLQNEVEGIQAPKMPLDVLVAMTEVDNALVQERQQELHIELLEQQIENSTNTLREARARYREGLSDFLPVLTSLTSLQLTELNLLTARRQLISYRIQLYRALGGTWTHDLVAPEIAPRDEEEDAG